MAKPNMMYPPLVIPGVKEPLVSIITKEPQGNDGEIHEKQEFFIKFFIPEHVSFEDLALAFVEYRSKAWKKGVPNIILSLTSKLSVTLRGDVEILYDDINTLIVDAVWSNECA